MSDKTSYIAIEAMCKHAIFVLENSEGTRKSKLRGIQKLTGKYRLHLKSLSEYFSEYEAMEMNDSQIMINGEPYTVVFIDGWLVLTKLN